MNIRSVPKAAFDCRDERCQWERERKHDNRVPMCGTYRWDLCVRCGNWRCRIQRSDGSIMPNSTTYEYSSAYEAAKVFTREDARLELDRRAKDRTTRTTVVRGRTNLRVAVA